MRRSRKVNSWMLVAFIIFARTMAVNVYKAPRIRKSIETESGLVVARGCRGERVTTNDYRATFLPWGVLKMFWNLTAAMAAKHCARTKCHRIVHFKTVEDWD